MGAFQKRDIVRLSDNMLGEIINVAPNGKLCVRGVKFEKTPNHHSGRYVRKNGEHPKWIDPGEATPVCAHK